MFDEDKEKIEYEEIGFGKILTSLLDNEDITDIEVRPTLNDIGFGLWIVDANKGRSRINLDEYSDDEIDELIKTIENMPSQLKYNMHSDYSATEPALDAEMVYEDKAILRINCIHESLTGSNNIPLIAIRKSSYDLRLTKEYMVESKFVGDKFFDLMDVVIQASCNIMIAGQVGSGKTSLLKYLIRYIRQQESIITIEDTREAFLDRLYPEKETGSLKSNNKEEKTKFEMLSKYCLRQNMQWEVVSEIRGTAVIDLMDAVGSGHNLISTIHADGVEEIPFRMVNMAKTDGATSRRLYDQIFQDINIGIFIFYYNDEQGSHRQVKEVCEYYTDERGKPQTHMLYQYDETTGEYKIDQIKSTKIINKIKRKKIDYSKIKGVFINE